jgi:hypothetical protein
MLWSWQHNQARNDSNTKHDGLMHIFITKLSLITQQITFIIEDYKFYCFSRPQAFNRFIFNFLLLYYWFQFFFIPIFHCFLYIFNFLKWLLQIHLQKAIFFNLYKYQLFQILFQFSYHVSICIFYLFNKVLVYNMDIKWS